MVQYRRHGRIARLIQDFDSVNFPEGKVLKFLAGCWFFPVLTKWIAGTRLLLIFSIRRHSDSETVIQSPACM